MGDTGRGLLIGVFVGLIGGMMIGALIVGLVREYAAPTGFSRFLIDYGQLASISIGVVIGAIGAYRMLQNLHTEGEEET